MNKLLITAVMLYCFVLSASSQTNKAPATMHALLAAGMNTNATEALEAINRVLKENPEMVFATNRSGRTPLFFAVTGGNTDVVQAFLAYNARVNVKDTNGTTPLHLASGVFGCKQVAALLLANKAEVNAADQRGETPLLKAAMTGRDDVAELLIANKADVNAKNSEGRTALHFAATRADQRLAELLLSNKAEVNASDKNGDTPLRLLTRGRTAEYVAELRQESQSVTHSRDHNGSIIMRNPRDELAKLLFQHGGHQ